MYILAHFVILFLPGLILCFGIRVARLAEFVCLSFALSLIELTLLIVLAKRFHLTVTTILLLWLGLLVLSLVWLLAGWRKSPPGLRQKVNSAAFSSRWDIIALFIIAAATGIYFYLAGPYLELPSDVFAHLEYAQGALADLADGNFTGGFPMAILSGPGNYSWYYIFALLCALTSTDFQSALLPATLANVLTLMIVLFAFSTIVFEAQSDRRRRSLLALVSCIIFFVTFGTNIFAFVRYYALAPTLLNMALYFSVIAILLRYVRAGGVPLVWCCFILLAMLVAWLIHEQETLFIFLTGLCLSLYAVIARLSSGKSRAVDVNVSTGVFERTRIPWLVIALAGTGALVSAVIWSHLTLDRYLVTDTKLLSLQSLLPTSRDLYVLNPARQFYQTISLLGVLIYGLSIFHFKTLRRYPYLSAGLLSPALTVFNPFFADFFLRHSFAESFWRFCYLIPVAFVTSLILISCVDTIRNGQGIRRAASLLALVAIVVAIVLPAKVGGHASWTRWPTLIAKDSASAIDHWRDLIDQVEQMPVRTQLYTDPVTGYLLTGMTSAQSRRKKFHRYPHDQLSLEYLTRARLRRSHDALLIVNLRDAKPSKNGELSRHWPAQITQTGAYYRPELLKFIADNPSIFSKIWQQDRISIYRIVSN